MEDNRLRDRIPPSGPAARDPRAVVPADAETTAKEERIRDFPAAARDPEEFARRSGAAAP